MSSPHSTLTATRTQTLLFLFGVKGTSFLTPTPPPPPPIIAVGDRKSYGARTLKMSTIFSLLRVASTATRKTFSARARATQRTKLLLWSSWDFPTRPQAATKKCSHKKLIYFYKHACRVASSCPTIYHRHGVALSLLDHIARVKDIFLVEVFVWRLLHTFVAGMLY